MAIALRPRASASVISSRYGSQALALGARPGRTAARSVDTSGEIAAFDGSASVDASDEMAGFEEPESVDTSGGEMAVLGVHRGPENCTHQTWATPIAARYSYVSL